MLKSQKSEGEDTGPKTSLGPDTIDGRFRVGKAHELLPV